MTIDINTVHKAASLKKKLDAAYTVFKKNPTVENSTTWANATRTFNNYCISLVNGLIEKESSNKHEEILNNFSNYKSCKTCKAELAYLVDDNNYIVTNSFVEDFPGWCYNCLIEHCTSLECSDCALASGQTECPFLEVKQLHLQDN